MKIVKPEGQTRTERLLSDLCESTFLKIWSYPSPFKDDGKELCDLLAVFENHVFIFFDRESLRFEDDEKDVLTAWGRWEKEVIGKQISTCHGAERYVRSNRKIFLDHKLETLFPVRIPSDDLKVHKIVVAHGAKEACEKFSDANVSGSLAITYGDVLGRSPFPFMVHLDRSNPVHVLDSHNLEILLSELDTFFDFTSYLEVKEEAIGKLDLIVYCGEEDLLANYLSNFSEKKNQHFIGSEEKNFNALAIPEGEWDGFKKTSPYIRKKQSDKVSYFWDEIIQRTCQNALDGVLLGDANIFEGVSPIHEMAKEPRFIRRALSDHMIKAIKNFPETTDKLMRNLSVMPSFYEGKIYAFLQVKQDNARDYESECRPLKQKMLEIACGTIKNKNPHLKKVIGIAIDAPKFSRRNSEDFILLNCDKWPEEVRQEYEEANKLVGFLESDSLKQKELKVTEFPAPPVLDTPGKIGRNDKCPCGSGKKYKKCCGA